MNAFKRELIYQAWATAETCAWALFIIYLLTIGMVLLDMVAWMVK